MSQPLDFIGGAGRDRTAGLLNAIHGIDNPQLFHYGNYEGSFLRRMKERYPDLNENIDKLIAESLNVLTVIYSHVYFPTYSNGLKNIAEFLGFVWSEKEPSGLKCLLWRYNWECTKNQILKQNIITYNIEDCIALENVTNKIIRLIPQDESDKGVVDTNIVHTESMKRKYPYSWGEIKFSLAEFDYINKCAYWDYQRDKIYIRTSPILKRIAQKKKKNIVLPINKVFEASRRWKCPKCGATKVNIHGRHSKLTYDMKFTQFGVKRWVIKHLIVHYKCKNCNTSFPSDEYDWTKHLYGSELFAYVIYHNIELHIAQVQIAQSMNKLFGYNLGQPAINKMKTRGSEFYFETYEAIKQKLVNGKIIHADETKVSAKGEPAFVWVFTSLEEVIYVYTQTREGEILKTVLDEFKGVLVSDFYAAYDSIDCPQQKCLIHLIRDINDDLLKNPFNEEMKLLAQEFALLLKPIIQTVDQFGLKKHFLAKHKCQVQQFFKNLAERAYSTEIAVKCQKRFNKNQETLFTFLDYDGVSWNNNNAEHAIKAFAQLRRVIIGSSNESGIREYLILLSVCETCKYKGVNFLDFLRSGEKDIAIFAESKRRKRGEMKLGKGVSIMTHNILAENKSTMLS